MAYETVQINISEKDKNEIIEGVKKEIDRVTAEVLRNEFAKAALTGLTAQGYSEEDYPPDVMAKISFEYADAMLKHSKGT